MGLAVDDLAKRAAEGFPGGTLLRRMSICALWPNDWSVFAYLRRGKTAYHRVHLAVAESARRSSELGRNFSGNVAYIVQRVSPVMARDMRCLRGTSAPYQDSTDFDVESGDRDAPAATLPRRISPADLGMLRMHPRVCA